jgi:hypothetical protein
VLAILPVEDWILQLKASTLQQDFISKSVDYENKILAEN